MYEDIVLYTGVAASSAFFVLGWIMLSRYRNLVARMSDSADVGRNLWNALDLRLKRQDERILDVMTRFQVYEAQRSERGESPLARDAGERSGRLPRAESKERGSSEVVSSVGIIPEATERVVLQLLLERGRSSVEIKSLINKSREHTARLMKSLFEKRLVGRDDSKKPFVYQLTEEGRRYLSAS